MSLKTILVAASGGGANEGAVEVACRLAKQFDAHVEGIHVKTDVNQVIALAGDGFNMPIPGEWIDQLVAEIDALARRTKSAFEAAAARAGLALGTAASWREETGYAPRIVAGRARFFDLVVLGRSERVVDQPHTDAVEETLLHSGRPVLLAPAKPPAELGQAVALGWNGSAEAVRVMSGAMPILKAARAVTAITVGDAGSDTMPALLDYLARHGVSARHHRAFPVEGVGAGELLLSDARDQGADLLVMGAYGHRPWREILFGGATRQVVGRSLLPVLLSH